MEFNRNVLYGKLRKIKEQEKQRADKFASRHKGSLILVGGICAMCCVAGLWFGTEYMSDPEVDETFLLDASPYVRKHIIVNEDSAGGFLEDTQQEAGSGIGVNTNVKGEGKLITDRDKNPYLVPLYDGLTMDAEAMGIESYSIPYANNPFPVIQQASQGGNYIVTSENRRCEGGNQSWNWYDEVNYSPYAKCGENLPYTEIDGRLSIAVPWRWTVHPSTFPLESPAGNMKGNSDTVGLYYDVVFTDGTVLAVIGGSAKGIENDTNSKYQGYMHYQACPMEVVQYTDLPVGKPWSDGYKFAVDFCNQRGIPTTQYGPSWTPILAGGKTIQEVVVYRVQHYTPTQGYKCWFTGE